MANLSILKSSLYPSDWNDQRVYVANNWNRRNNAYQQAERDALEAQMRTQWQ